MIKPILETKNFLVVDKPAGVVVNKSATTSTVTLQDELAMRFSLSSGDLGVGGRAGIVHRLDRETSGVLLVAKNEKTFANFQCQFKDRVVIKMYVSLLHGVPSSQKGVIKTNVGRVGKFGRFGQVEDGKEAITEYEVTDTYKLKAEIIDEYIMGSGQSKNRANYLRNHASNYSMINFSPKTGRTHQLRIHAKMIAGSIVADEIYSPSKLLKFDKFWCSRLFLHASYIRFWDPASSKFVEAESGLPKDLKNAILNLVKI